MRYNCLLLVLTAMASVLCDHPPYTYQYVDSVEEDRSLVWHRPRNPLRKQVIDLVGPGTLVPLVAVSVLRMRLNALR